MSGNTTAARRERVAGGEPAVVGAVHEACLPDPSDS